MKAQGSADLTSSRSNPAAGHATGWARSARGLSKLTRPPQLFSEEVRPFLAGPRLKDQGRQDGCQSDQEKGGRFEPPTGRGFGVWLVGYWSIARRGGREVATIATDAEAGAT